MIRKIVIFVFALIVALNLYACGGNGGQTGNDDNSQYTIWNFETAYAQAQELGYSGTLQEFIDSIHGEKGEMGATGEKGEKGDPGEKGEKGDPGENGVGISNVSVNSQNELIISYTDGTSINLGNIFGCKHEYSAWVESEPATCSSKGVKVRKCNKCDKAEYSFIEQHGHQYGEWVEMFAICTGKWRVCYCTECGESQTDKIVSGIGHIYYQGNCIYCGDLHTKGLKYELKDNCYYVSGIGECKDAIIRIPRIYNDLPVEGISNSAFANCDAIQEIYFPDTLNYIGDHAFSQCINLRGVITIPNLINKIGDGVFYNCKNIDGLVCNEKIESVGNSAFANCEKLTGEIVLPNSLKTIADNAFSNCKSVLKITLGSGVEDVGYAAFSDCLSLHSVYMTDSVKKLGDYAFSKCQDLVDVRLSNSIEVIGCSIFSNCDSLRELTLPNETKSVEYEAFYSCDKLEQIYFNDKIEKIGGYAFQDCKSLKSANLPDSIKTLGAGVFRGAESLSQVKLPNEITEINSQLFYYCSSLKNVDIPQTVKIIRDVAFSWTGIEDIVIGEAVESIAEGVFYGCANLQSVSISGFGDLGIEFNDLFAGSSQLDGFYHITVDSKHNKYSNIPKTLTKITVNGCSNLSLREWIYLEELCISNGEIKGSAFSGCKSLSEVDLGTGISAIGGGAFQYCEAITNIDIPEGVTSIGDDAFWDCTNLETINIPSSINEFGDLVFLGCNKLKGEKHDGGIYLGSSASPYTVLLSIEDQQYNGVFNLHEDTKFICSDAMSSGHLTEVVLNDKLLGIGRSAFWGCGNLRVIELPESLERLGMYSFDYSGIERIKIPNKVTNLESNFKNCANLTKVELGDDIIEIAGDVFDQSAIFNDDSNWENGILYVDDYMIAANFDDLPNELVINENVRGMSDYLFQNCSKLTSVLIEGGLEIISSYAFSNCTSLSSVTMRKDVKKIDYSAFNNCINLSSLIFNDGLEEICDNAFSGCENLTEVNIPDTVIRIGAGVFKSTNLTDISIPDTVEDIGDEAFMYNNSLNYNLYGNAYYLGSKTNPYMILMKAVSIDITQAEIHKDTKFIASEAFNMVDGLEKILIPEGVIRIGNRAFACCEEADIPNSVKYIGYGAFRQSTTVKLGNGIVEVEYGAFDRSRSLFYCGTKNEWDALKLSVPGEIYFYSEEKPSYAGDFWHYDAEGDIAIWYYEAN